MGAAMELEITQNVSDQGGQHPQFGAFLERLFDLLAFLGGDLVGQISAEGGVIDRTPGLLLSFALGPQLAGNALPVLRLLRSLV